MKIDENLLNKDNSGYIQNHLATHFTQMIYWMMIIVSHQFSPQGRVGGFHLLRY
jgi:hypothetical protein